MGDGMDKFIGRWDVTGTENMEEMLKAFGECGIPIFTSLFHS